jgi:uncharacterized protein (DUF362 family)
MAVFLTRQRCYDVAEIRSRLEEALEALHERPSGRRAVIKPNLGTQLGRASGATTDPSIVEAIHDALRDRGFTDIAIADGPSINRPVEEVFKKSGMSELARRLRVPLVDLNQAPRRMLTWPYGEIGLPTLVLDADYYVNVPKMKTHVRVGVTLSLKSQMGLCDYEEKRNNHKRGLDEPLGQLSKILRPHLIVLDGVEGMEGNGPTHGQRNSPGVFAVGTDPVEFDTVVAQVMGYRPEEVPIISHAATAPCRPDICGLAIEDVASPFKRPNHGECQRMLGLRAPTNVRSCNGCDLNVTIVKESLRSNPGVMLRYGPRILPRILFGRIDVLKGEQCSVPADHGTLVFVGDCTAELAAKHAGTFVRGCPPDPHAILDALAGAGSRWRSNDGD